MIGSILLREHLPEELIKRSNHQNAMISDDDQKNESRISLACKDVGGGDSNGCFITRVGRGKENPRRHLMEDQAACPLPPRSIVSFPFCSPCWPPRFAPRATVAKGTGASLALSLPGRFAGLIGDFPRLALSVLLLLACPPRARVKTHLARTILFQTSESLCFSVARTRKWNQLNERELSETSARGTFDQKGFLTTKSNTQRSVQLSFQ